MDEELKERIFRILSELPTEKSYIDYKQILYNEYKEKHIRFHDIFNGLCYGHVFPNVDGVCFPDYGYNDGLFLQLFNIVIGTAIYVPFVRLYEKYEIENSPKDYNKMLDILRDAENRGARVNFSEDPAFCLTAKALIADLKAAIKRGELIL